MGVKRVFVVEGVSKEFIDKLTKIVEKLRPGIDYGPYIREDALAEVERRIKDAVKNGAKLICGGKRVKSSKGSGYWLSPSVLLLDNQNVDLVRLETFGNTLPIVVAKDTDDAINMANDSTYGLSNSIFTSNLDQANKLSSRLQSGLVFVNDPFIAVPGWDYWTGWKNSGFGTPESKILQCFKQQTVSVNEKGHKRAFWYPDEER